MAMYLEPSLIPGPQQTINISAKLIQSIKILQYSAEELEQSIAQELSENPAFEVEEFEQCTRCGAPLTGTSCPACGAQADSSANETQAAEDVSWDDYREDYAASLATAGEDEGYDPLTFVRSGDTLQEHLLVQLGSILPWEDQEIAEYLVGNLDSHGYLTVTVAEASVALGVTDTRVECVLTALQGLDPIGIGARDLRECLLIQLRAFRERDKPNPLAESLVARYLGALGEHHFLDIGRDLNVTSTQVKHAWRFIKANLNPFPAHAFDGMPGNSSAGPGAGDQAVLIKPDVIIRRTTVGFESEVIEQRRFRFALHPTYHALTSNGVLRGLPDNERQHVRHYAARAKFFIECVCQRWETLRRICEALIELQPNFLDRGVRCLRPLTRGELATHVGLHESTVSRATAGKYVLLPSGRTIPVDDFFDSSLATKDTLRELIATENPARPFSDEDLAALLCERGLPVARRTVAKYRESMRILPSRFRI
jgi:RNA polymerase sigma-54 factor